MYWSSVIEVLVEQRLAEARAGASQRALLRSLRAARRPSRASRWLRAALRAVVAPRSESGARGVNQARTACAFTGIAGQDRWRGH